MAATMADVARLAGVSTKTVSNVVNGHPHIRPTTKARVQEAIGKLGYEVNVTARNLRRGRTGLISLAMPELKLPYFAELADSVIAEADALGLGVLVEQTNYDRDRELEILQGSRRAITDGVIFSPLALGTEDIHLFRPDFPLVLLGERIFGSPFDHVTMNNAEAARTATEHLLAMGRRRILLIGTHDRGSVGTASLREQGYREAHAAAGLPVDTALFCDNALWHRDSGAEAVRHALDTGVEFDAVFGMNDALAIGALHVLNERHIDIPGQVAVIGFDDIEEASYTQPTLTSVQPGRAQIARDAVRLLAERIDDRVAKAPVRKPAQRIFAEYTLVARESTGGE